VQGYYLSPPRPAADVETILRKLDRRLNAPVI
jgi:EAL domain-containing protein (putative c-di-GMP-specific phosphodiesterase class I)